MSITSDDTFSEPQPSGGVVVASVATFELRKIGTHVDAIDTLLDNLPDDIAMFVNETAAFADDAKAISKR